MPRPNPVPDHLALEATIRPNQGAVMRTVDGGKSIPIKIFCTEKKVSEFQIIEHGVDQVTIEATGRKFHVEWSNAQNHWSAGQRPPERISVPNWARQGARMKYVGTRALNVTSAEQIVVTGRMTGVFTIQTVFARHLIVTAEGLFGQLRLDLTEETFRSEWQMVSSKHDDRIKSADFIRVGRRVQPKDPDGKRVGIISYLVTEYTPNDDGCVGGTFEMVPLFGDGVRGSPMRMPLWNSADMWAPAPDDPMFRRLEPGMTVRNGNQEYRVLRVDAGNKSVEVERLERSTFNMTDADWEIVEESSTPDTVNGSRYTRLENDAL